MPDHGSLYLNLGDTYWSGGSKGKKAVVPIENKSTYVDQGATIKIDHAGRVRGVSQRKYPKFRAQDRGHEFIKKGDKTGIPWATALALVDDGWILKADIIWAKPDPQPTGGKNRPVPNTEHIHVLTKSRKSYYNKDMDLNTILARRTVTGGGGHFAAYPLNLITPLIEAGCPEGGTVLDPFNGSATTSIAAIETGRKFIGFELNEDYAHNIAEPRIRQFIEEYETNREFGF